MDTKILDKVIESYKAEFEKIRNEERNKWHMTKEFKNNWKIDATDFKAMFQRAFPIRSDSLIIGRTWFPLSMIEHFCDSVGNDEVRSLFVHLYDESKDLKKRVNDFIETSKKFLEKYNEEGHNAANSCQDTRIISIYLAFNEPDKYYIYKASLYRYLEDIFGFKPPKGFDHIDRMLKYYEWCNEICEYLKRDANLVEMHKNAIRENEYNDEKLHILTQDIIFAGAVRFAGSIAKDKIDSCWYLGAYTDDGSGDKRKADKYIEDGVWISGFDEEKYKKIVNSIKPGEKIALKSTYTQRKNLPFDVGGSTVSVMEIKAIGEVVENHFDGKTLEVKWEKCDPPKKWYFYTVRSTFWHVEYDSDTWMKRALIDFTFKDKKQDYERFLADPYWLDKYSPSDTDETSGEGYTDENFWSEVYMEKEKLEQINYILDNKKNLILQGAPGVGKTFAAKRIAYQKMGKKDESRICFIQFHQSYCYEDFIGGYKPKEQGFEYKPGPFFEFCQKAEDDINRPYFLIIDEINRGNISKIFGELLVLIEADKRGEKVTLPNGDEFSVPPNLHIIGMMNTADRSLAMIDYALRRRFSFVEFSPAFDNKIFRKKIESLNSEKLNKLIETVKQLNEEISRDPSLGKGFQIGHSYFCIDNASNIALKNIVQYELIPLLEEYWFDNEDQIKKWSNMLKAVI